MQNNSSSHNAGQLESSRRQFIGGALGAAAALPMINVASAFAAEEPKSPAQGRKIKLGLIGCGKRGNMLAKLFKDHGGYDFHAMADYFPDVAEACGKGLGVVNGRCFSGLSGYKKVIESGVEAVAIETPPYFISECAEAAAKAGLHVYMAKPVAVDVPGCLRVESAGKLATQKQRVFHVDYQMPTDPANIKVAEMIRNQGLDQLVKVTTVGVSGGHADPPRTATIESRLSKSVWGNEIALSGDWINNFDIHEIEAAIWILGKHPIAATGASRIGRIDPHGDSRDAISVIYEYADGLIHEHSGQALPNAMPAEISCTFRGATWHAVLDYYSKAKFHLRGKKPFSADVVNLYPEGAKRNVAMFYDAVTAGNFQNPTIRYAVESCLTCILGREAAARGRRLTLDELIKENKRIELDLTGLKV